jgi:hypothetical protein
VKNLIFAVGLSAFLIGATSVGVCAESLNAVMLKKDNEQRWRECSGPNGERDPSALPLYEAIFARDKDKVSALLEQGASPNSVLYPKRWSPLMLATAYNDHDIVRVRTQ